MRFIWAYIWGELVIQLYWLEGISWHGPECFDSCSCRSDSIASGCWGINIVEWWMQKTDITLENINDKGLSDLLYQLDISEGYRGKIWYLELECLMFNHTVPKFTGTFLRKIIKELTCYSLFPSHFQRPIYHIRWSPNLPQDQYYVLN